MGQVPISIKVLSVLGIIFSAITLLGGPCSLFLVLHPLAPNPLVDELMKDPVYVIYVLIAGAIRFLMGLLLLYGSIASLKLKRSGRTAMIVYAWALVCFVIINSIFTLVLVLPRMKVAVAHTPGMMPEMVKIMSISGIVGVVIGVIFAGAIAALILYFYNRTVARNAFKGVFPDSPAQFPIDYPPGNYPAA